MKYRVLITTSGLETRLGELTKYTNKTLVRVGKKPAISYIIESYPKASAEFVVTLGHYGNQVKDFLKNIYPDIKFDFINVDKYQGPGSSLGYSMLAAKNFLQLPFIFHASDTIVEEKIESPNKNWLGGFKGESSDEYSSFLLKNNQVSDINNKNFPKFDYLHIGLVGIKDYLSFWDSLEKNYQKNPQDQTISDVTAIDLMIKDKKVFEAKEFKTWFDVGNLKNLQTARQNIKDAFSNLDKVEESTFFINGSVVKFHHDPKNIAEKVARAKILSKLVPKAKGLGDNFFKYPYAQGDVYSQVVTPVDFKKFLIWCQKNLWSKQTKLSNKEFRKICYDFYYTKTIQRTNKFLKSNNLKDSTNIINGEKVPPLKNLFKIVDFNWLANGLQAKIHGDLILENVIKTKTGYKLIDWRQNFGGELEVGDIYYDLSKMNHNLTVNHDMINQNFFEIKIDGNKVNYNLHRLETLIQCQKVLFEFLKKQKYDPKKVEILTAIIWLNMSPLHHFPFNQMLFYHGKLNLWRALQNNIIDF